MPSMHHCFKTESAMQYFSSKDGDDDDPHREVNSKHALMGWDLLHFVQYCKSNKEWKWWHQSASYKQMFWVEFHVSIDLWLSWRRKYIFHTLIV